MNFYVISIQKTADTNPVGIFAYPDKESALAAYHSTLFSNYSNVGNLTSFCTMVINEHGGTEAREYWEKPYEPEPQPEPEPEPNTDENTEPENNSNGDEPQEESN